MCKKITILATLIIFIFSTIGAYAEGLSQPTAESKESAKDRLSRGVNNLFYGPTEVPKNLDQTKTKGTKVEKCSEKTRSGVERGIARFVTGVWQIATFWYAEPEATTTAKAKQVTK